MKNLAQITRLIFVYTLLLMVTPPLLSGQTPKMNVPFELTKEEEVVLTEYARNTDLIQYNDAEKVLLSSIQKFPDSLPLRWALVEHQKKYNTSNLQQLLLSQSELITKLGAEEDRLGPALAGDIAKTCRDIIDGEISKSQLRTTIPFLILIGVLKDGEGKYSSEYLPLYQNIFQGRALPNEPGIQARRSRALLTTVRNVLAETRDEKSWSSILVQIQDMYGADLDSHLQSKNLKEWTQDSQTYFQYLVRSFHERLSFSKFPDASEFDKIQPIVRKMLAMVAASSLAQDLDAPVRAAMPNLVETQEEFIKRFDAKISTEMHESLLLVTLYSGLHNRFYQMYLYDMNSRFRIDEKAFTNAMTRFVEKTFRGLATPLLIAEVNDPSSYKMEVERNLETLFFMTSNVPDMVTDSEYHDVLADIMMCSIDEYLSANIADQLTLDSQKLSQSNRMTFIAMIPYLSGDNCSEKWLTPLDDLLKKIDPRNNQQRTRPKSSPERQAAVDALARRLGIEKAKRASEM